MLLYRRKNPFLVKRWCLDYDFTVKIMIKNVIFKEIRPQRNVRDVSGTATLCPLSMKVGSRQPYVSLHSLGKPLYKRNKLKMIIITILFQYTTFIRKMKKCWFIEIINVIQICTNTYFSLRFTIFLLR